MKKFGLGILGGFIGWPAGIYLYLAILWMAGAEAAGGIHLGAFVMGLAGVIVGAKIAIRLGGGAIR